MSEFIMQKAVDKSLFRQGFNVPIKARRILSEHLSRGALEHGEKRRVIFFFDGREYELTLRSINFDRKKYASHPDIWQFVYGASDPFARCLREIFSSRQSGAPTLETREYLVLYATELDDRFFVEPIINREFAGVRKFPSEFALEHLIELPTLTDESATLIETYGLSKVRRLNRSLGDQLKRYYKFRCQICGADVGARYGVELVECHHIDYFVESLNNDADNLLIVCPNHHRLIHATDPIFDREAKIYRYPNGCVERLKLNLHL